MRSGSLPRRVSWSAGCLALALISGCPPTTPTDTTSQPVNRDSLPGTPVARSVVSSARFQRNDLTYFINNVSTRLDQDLQARLIADAFSRWSAVTPLNFTRVNSQDQADIVIGFGSGQHCDLYAPRNLTCPTRPFETTTIGHAYYPEGANTGQLHMNEAFDFSDQRLYFSTMVHEIGHNLGIDHIAPTNAVMFANDTGQTGDLTQDDINAAQRLYGSRDGSVRPDAAGAPPATDANASRTAPTTTSPDADGDGIDDATEQFVLGTNPDNADSDGDGLGDGVEVAAGLDATNADTDGDGVSDGVELDGAGNAFRPDFSSTGDVSALVGTYSGSDNLGATLQFVVATDGSISGTLAAKRFGFDENVGLVGALRGDGSVRLESFDYFFKYSGTIATGGTGSGQFSTHGGTNGTWSATRSGGAPKTVATPIIRVDLGQYAPRRAAKPAH